MIGTMSSYGQFCPIAQAAQILAERWTPLVLRELICGSTASTTAGPARPGAASNTT